MSTPLGAVTRTYEDGTTGWAGSGATISRVTDAPRWGEGCCRVETAGAAAFEAIFADLTADVASTGSKQWTLSFYVRTTEQVGLTAQAQAKSGSLGAGGGFLANHNVNLGFVNTGGEWERKTATFVTHADATRIGNFRVYTNSQIETTFDVDGWQLDEGPDALEYDGSDVPAPEPEGAGGLMMLMGTGGGGGGPTPVPPGPEPFFAASSPFNAPIPDDPELFVASNGSTSADIVTHLLSHGASKADLMVVNPGGSWDYSHPIYYAQPGDPLVTVNLSETWDGGHVQGRTLRVPADAAPAPGGDAHLAIVQLEEDPDISADCQGMIVGFYDVTSWTGSWSTSDVIEATSGGKSHAVTGTGTDFGNVTAAGFNLAAGIPLASELAAGEIPHALFVVTNCSDSNAVAPAQPGTTAAVCGTSRYPGLSTPVAMPPMGARMQLDPAYDISGFPAGQRALLRALQVYGGYVGDTGMYSKSVMFGLMVESPESGGQELEDYCAQAVVEGWGSTDDNNGTPVWYLDFGKNVDWSNLRFVELES